MWKVSAVLFRAPAVILATLVMGAISMVASIWDRTGFTQHRVAQAWARILLAVGGVRCTVIGLEKLDPNRPYVIASNHASYYDTPVVLASIPLQFRFFAKKGLFSIPMMGGHLRRAGHLPVVRNDPRGSLKSITEGAKNVKERGISLLLFPEGGRTIKQMRLFKEGAAYLAIRAGVPAVPIGLRNTRAILPMHSGLIRPGSVELVIGDPIDTSEMTTQDRGRLNQMLQDRVAEIVGEIPVDDDV